MLGLMRPNMVGSRNLSVQCRAEKAIGAFRSLADFLRSFVYREHAPVVGFGIAGRDYRCAAAP